MQEFEQKILFTCVQQILSLKPIAFIDNRILYRLRSAVGGDMLKNLSSGATFFFPFAISLLTNFVRLERKSHCCSTMHKISLKGCNVMKIAPLFQTVHLRTTLKLVQYLTAVFSFFCLGPKQGFSKQLEGVGSYRRTRSDTRQSGDMHSELSSQQSQKQPIQYDTFYFQTQTLSG